TNYNIHAVKRLEIRTEIYDKEEPKT
ncbi:MAG: hypothetical protein RJB08_1656, partial [Actinomycetota bacterium]